MIIERSTLGINRRLGMTTPYNYNIGTLEMQNGKTETHELQKTVLSHLVARHQRFFSRLNVNGC